MSESKFQKRHNLEDTSRQCGWSGRRKTGLMSSSYETSWRKRLKPDLVVPSENMTRLLCDCSPEMLMIFRNTISFTRTKCQQNRSRIDRYEQTPKAAASPLRLQSVRSDQPIPCIRSWQIQFRPDSPIPISSTRLHDRLRKPCKPLRIRSLIGTILLGTDEILMFLTLSSSDLPWYGAL